MQTKEKEDCENLSNLNSQITMTESTESMVRNINVCRSVVIEIMNKTRNVVLQDFRSYCFSGRVHSPLPFEIGPGSRGKCAFAKTPYSLRGSVGVLVCKLNSSVLAIMFSNPFDYVLYHIEFALEIFTADNHLGSLHNVYSNMMRNKTYSTSTLFQRGNADSEHETLEVSKGTIRVRAKMSNNEKAVMKVQIEDIDPPPYQKNA
ncbi:DELTA-thalatoxin-Avl1a [Struthio camelus]|uniref:DELTA-thalatoxin-Avl1a n=1 Tax=Struthio camelus TaxID=8801 RepID=UPI0036040FF2